MLARFMMVRSILAPLALIGLVGGVGAAVQRYAGPPGGLQLPAARTTEGNSAVRMGKPQYPREAIDSDNVRVRMSRPAYRIASQYWAIDEYVYSVVPPERVIAVSESAYLPQVSNVYNFVRAMNGHMVIESRVGEGTRIALLFKAVVGEGRQHEPEEANAPRSAG